MGRCALALGKVCAGLGELLPKAGKVSISKISAPEGSEGASRPTFGKVRAERLVLTCTLKSPLSSKLLPRGLGGRCPDLLFLSFVGGPSLQGPAA